MGNSRQDLALLREYLEITSPARHQRLPAERLLAEKLGITRSRLRTGLKKLETEGLIWRHVGKGTFYGPKLEPVGFPFPMNSAQHLANPREVMTARLVLEPALSRRAALQATLGDLQQMHALQEQMIAARDWNSWDILDCRLHRAIAAAAGSRLMLLLFDTVQAHRNTEIWGRLREIAEPKSSIERAVAEHLEIVDAIANRDQVRAETAMKKHLERIIANMFKGAE